MAYEFKLPDVGEGIHEGKILEWYHKPGDSVTEGDPLLKIETDKVVTDIPVPETGVLHQIHGEIDEVVDVGSVIAIIGAKGEEVTEAALAAQHAAVETAKHEQEEHAGDVGESFGVVGHIPVEDDIMPGTTEGREPAVVEKGNGRRALATPVARKMARDLGMDINMVKGTGTGGRVMKKDINAASQGGSAVAVSGAPAGSGYKKPAPVSMPSPKGTIEVEELSQIRKTIANRMVLSKYTAPHSTQLNEIEVSRLVELRERKNAELAKDGIKLTYMPFILKALTIALQRNKKLNCRLDMDKGQVTYFKYYNIGIAVDTDAGLVVPVIKNADQLSIIELAAAIQDLSARARKRELTLDEIQGGTFTVTNYGSLNGQFGVPVINYPEVAILGVGRIQRQPVIIDEEIVKGWVMPLSLGFDHRIVDGGDSGRFMNDFLSMLHDPMNMLMF
jgi:pyruvate dehydrogenase E2 component (dihydrolipoamide acetyltransferase)